MRSPSKTARSLALCALALSAGLTGDATAEIDGQVFTARQDRIKLTLPKGWRPSDAASYPGVLLYLLRSQPEARIIVGAEPLRHELVCSWPAECRALAAPLAQRYACAIKKRLEENHNVGEIKAGPKENTVAGLPSVWFELTDNRRFVRLAIAANERRAVTMSLTTNSVADRALHARAFDQVLRSLHELTEVEAEPQAPGEGEAVTPGDQRLALPLYDANRPCAPST